MIHTYQSAILGGTFDHLHVGHEQFILSAFTQAKYVTIGLVHDLLGPTKSYLDSLEDYHTRLDNLETFLHKQNLIQRAQIIPIFDIYGTTLTDYEIETIFVTPTTRSNALIINQERKSRGMSPLTIITIKEAMGDDGEIISSSRIRMGEIDRQGTSYLKFFMQKTSYLLPDNMRDTLQNPIGPIVSNVQELTPLIPSSALVITIGDIVSLTLNKSGFPTTINVIDSRTRRHAIAKLEIEKYFPKIHHHLINPPGTINTQFASIFQTALSRHTSQTILVEGEEDLLALPAILLAPLNSYIIYGQYNLGMVVVKITETIKAKAKQLLTQF